MQGCSRLQIGRDFVEAGVLQWGCWKNRRMDVAKHITKHLQSKELRLVACYPRWISIYCQKEKKPFCLQRCKVLTSWSGLKGNKTFFWQFNTSKRGVSQLGKKKKKQKPQTTNQKTHWLLETWDWQWPRIFLPTHLQVQERLTRLEIFEASLNKPQEKCDVQQEDYLTHMSILEYKAPSITKELWIWTSPEGLSSSKSMQFAWFWTNMKTGLVTGQAGRTEVLT